MKRKSSNSGIGRRSGRRDGGSKSFAADLIVKDGDIYWSAFKIGEVRPALLAL